jgi:hypothetical protein
MLTRRRVARPYSVTPNALGPADPFTWRLARQSPPLHLRVAARRAGLTAAISAAPSAGAPTPGRITTTRMTDHCVFATATDATGGTPPYSYQWQCQYPRLGSTWTNATGPGVTTQAAQIQGLGPDARCFVRLKYTDSASNTATSATVGVNTPMTALVSGDRPRRLTTKGTEKQDVDAG